MIDIDAERVRFEASINGSYKTKNYSSAAGAYMDSKTDEAFGVWLAAKRDAITSEVSDEQAAG